MTSRTRASLGFWALTLSAAAAATTCNKTETTFHPPETTTGTSSGGGGTGGQVQPGCTNGFLDKGEADVDCGGATCPKCADGRACKFPADCANGVCTDNVCQAPTCDDAVRNGDETDVDCGGTCPTKCADDKVCVSDFDCTSSWCKPTTHKCKTPTCTDGLKNGEETDKDCGGKCSTKCADDRGCAEDKDCASDFCDVNATPPVCVKTLCGNGIKDDLETDVDCGGPKCDPCDDLKTCAGSSDCKSGVCPANNICQVPACNDGVKNGTESDVDCGAACTTKCADQKACTTDEDCEHGYCTTQLVCAAPTCTDSTRNGDETDVDCGGSCTTKCAANEKCAVDTDCATDYCDVGAPTPVCKVPSCTNTIQDGTETDLNCGGSVCPPCDTGKGCLVGSDCTSGVCAMTSTTLQCAGPSCSDTVKNGDETDVDCGGPTCPNKCGDTLKCLADSDCSGGYCNLAAIPPVCKSPVCNDKVKNGDETDVDCGGSCPTKCADGKACNYLLHKGADCVSGVCTNDVCQPPSCTDGVKNGVEGDIDCGSPSSNCPSRCPLTKTCNVAADCASGNCKNGICQCPDVMVTSPKPGGGAFCIEPKEVTYTQYEAFFTTNPAITSQDDYCKTWNFTFTPTGDWPAQPGHKNEPVRYVNWCQAAAYCKSVGRHLCSSIVASGQDASHPPPTPLSGLNSAQVGGSEWYSACSAQGLSAWPYGNTFQADYCVSKLEPVDGGVTGPANVDANPSCIGGTPGLLDMSGNVAEWEDACDAYVGGTDNCYARGGSFQSNTEASLQCNNGGTPVALPRSYTGPDVGIRCCLE